MRLGPWLRGLVCAAFRALAPGERLDGSGRNRLHHGAAHEEFGPLYWPQGNTIIYTSYVQHGQ